MPLPFDIVARLSCVANQVLSFVAPNKKGKTTMTKTQPNPTPTHKRDNLRMSKVPAFVRKRKHDGPASEDEESTESDQHNTIPLDIPIRDCQNLYAPPVTLDCAQKHGCVPCAYKIGLYDVALDAEFTKKVPNKRPEQCPRSSSEASPDGTMGYRQGMAALTVGDGDMSFSLALARILKPKDGSSTVIATSYEDKETLLKTYPSFEDNVKELESLGAKLFYNVDATRLSETLLPSTNMKFDRICWNFPCTAIANGQDGQNDDMDRNKDLVRKFMNGAMQMLNCQGEIHMCHKTKPPYNQWKLEHVALDSLPEDSIRYLGKVVLDRYLLPPYTPRKALNRKSFPCHDACFYVFGLVEASQETKGSKVPPTIDDENPRHSEHISSAVPITTDIILSIRNSLMATANNKPLKPMKVKRSRNL
jgi:25S rRNA (uracil2634-N3)-methyltransferase